MSVLWLNILIYRCLHFHCQMSAAVLMKIFCDQNRPIQFFHIRGIYMYNWMCRTINPMYVLIKLKLFSLNKIASVWNSPSTQSQAFGWRWGKDYCSTCLINWRTHQNTLVKRCISTTLLFLGIQSSYKFHHEKEIFKLRDFGYIHIVSSVLYSDCELIKYVFT